MVKNFVHVPSTVEAFEPEEIGVEQLLRDIKDVTVSTLTTDVNFQYLILIEKVNQKLTSLKGLVNKMTKISEYLGDVMSGKKKANLQIIYNLQVYLKEKD